MAGSLASSALAADAAPLIGTNPLFLTERFTPTSGPARPPLAGDVVPERLVALRGEREGFQFAFQNSTGAPLSLAARVVPDGALAGQQSAGTIDFELLRAAFVSIPTASTRVDSGAVAGSYAAGTYQDALPPFRNDVEAGRLSVDPGAYGGAAAIAKVRTDAAPGVYSGSIELYDTRSDTVYVRQAFSLDVRGATLLQNGSAGSFKTVMHVEGDQYWLQDRAMRNGVNEGLASNADRLLQLQGLMSFLDSRGVSLNEQPYGSPSATGAYSCSYTATNRIAPFSMLEQTKQRYFAPQRDINPAAQQFPTRMFPSETDGCDPSRPELGYHGKIDKHRTPTVKQDDILDPRAGTFYKNVAASWSRDGLFGTNSYVKNPFDEPSDVTANMRYQFNTQVPKANQLLHAALGKKSKVVLADWPRDSASRQICKPSGGKRVCTKLEGDGISNRIMWDGKGTDDVDVWMAPFSRLFGRPVSANVVKLNLGREREYADRLAKIKKLPGGREVWAYNFYTANAKQPQLTIDAPATDARMNYWMLAREGHTGLFVSNTILGWGSEVKSNTRGTRRKGGVWDGANYFQHGTYGNAAGWGTFLYPGYSAALGLTTEADRNSAQSRPVTTLRMEGLRDGQEDANLMRMYRTKLGDSGVKSVTKPIFGGAYIQLPRQLGKVMFPKYDNGNNLALRLEQQRRAMIAAVS